MLHPTACELVAPSAALVSARTSNLPGNERNLVRIGVSESCQKCVLTSDAADLVGT